MNQVLGVVMSQYSSVQIQDLRRILYLLEDKAYNFEFTVFYVDFITLRFILRTSQ